ncbi:MAG: hypothetical protein RML46_05085 [Anaerolineae bacterium]|nr:hypothetical protein [Anaerolineae bacterium]
MDTLPGITGFAVFVLPLLTGLVSVLLRALGRWMIRRFRMKSAQPV